MGRQAKAIYKAEDMLLLLCFFALKQRSIFSGVFVNEFRNYFNQLQLVVSGGDDHCQKKIPFNSS